MESQVVIVFGATGNVGPTVCRMLSENGNKVIVHYFSNGAKACEISENIKAAGGIAANLQADVRELESVEKMLATVERDYGRIDAVINLIHRDSDFKPVAVEDMQWGDWTGHLDALKSHFNICKSVLPYMKKNKYGRIIYLSGGLAYRFYKGCSAFSAVKAGLNAFCKTLALEVGSDNITVNIISPGKIVEKTEDEQSGKFSEDNVSKCPLGRFASPEDIANAALYFISEGASFITGQTLYVTGGEIMPMP